MHAVVSRPSTRTTFASRALAACTLVACALVETRDRGDSSALASSAAASSSAAADVVACVSDTRGSAQSTPAASTTPSAATAASIDFVERARERGLDYVNRSGSTDKPTILEANGAGVALLDLESDGDYDVAFSQGLASLAQALSGPGADVELYANDGAARFARASAPGLSGWWTGLASGDIDGDGHADLVAAAYGDLAALVQRDGRLTPRADAGLMPDPSVEPHARLVIGAPRERGHAPWWATSIALADLDRDGALDLYVGQYLELDPVAPPIGRLGEGPLSVACEWKEQRVFCGPQGLAAEPDRVLRGRGDGAFDDVSSAWLPQHRAGYTLAVAASDLDDDGDCDFYVACDSSPNLWLANDGAGVLRDRANELGVAVSTEGMAYAGMGVAIGDVNRDGTSDIGVTNFSEQPTEVYVGARAAASGALAAYESQTWRLGLGIETRRLLSWGVHLADFDADGWLELLTANGHVYPQADARGTDTRYGQAATLWRLPPGKRCVRVLPNAADSVLRPELGARGSAIGDLDGDGWQDLVLARIDGPAALGLYAGPRTQHRLLIRVAGAATAADAAPTHGADSTSTSTATATATARSTSERAPEPTREPASAPTLDAARDARGAAQSDAAPDATSDSTPARRTPRDGRGARVRVQLANERQPLELQMYPSSGYQSISAPELCFGLGAADRYAALEIRWPSGRVEHIAGGAADQRVWIVEGRGVVKREEL